MGWIERLRRHPEPSAQGWQARPGGPLIWVHISDEAWAGAACSLVSRMAAHRPDCCFVLTAPTAAPSVHMQLPDAAIWVQAPVASEAVAQAFLLHWHPQICAWIGPVIQSTLLRAAIASGLDVTLACADVGTDGRAGLLARRLFSDEGRINWQHLRQIHALNATAARALRLAGAPSDRITVSGPLQDAPLAPTCNEADREALMERLGGRQVWLADGISEDEEDILISAHEQARRGAHRLLLIMRPADPARLDDLLAKLRAQSHLTTADWTAGALPDRQTDVLLVDGLGETGLWPRVAPLTFVGGTILPSAPIRDPRIAVSLGSVVLFGPSQGPWLSVCSELAKAGAARIVRDVPTLGAALIQLIAPDRAASMALAGWQMLTEGAELTDLLVEDLTDRLDHLAGDP